MFTLEISCPGPFLKGPPTKTRVSNSSNNLLRGPLVRSYSIFDGILVFFGVGSFCTVFGSHDDDD